MKAKGIKLNESAFRSDDYNFHNNMFTRIQFGKSSFDVRVLIIYLIGLPTPYHNKELVYNLVQQACFKMLLQKYKGK